MEDPQLRFVASPEALPSVFKVIIGLQAYIDIGLIKKSTSHMTASVSLWSKIYMERYASLRWRTDQSS
jgi:hypothetical protein